MPAFTDLPLAIRARNDFDRSVVAMTIMSCHTTNSFFASRFASPIFCDCNGPRYRYPAFRSHALRPMAMYFVSRFDSNGAFTFARCLNFVLRTSGIRCSMTGFGSWNAGGCVRHD